MPIFIDIETLQQDPEEFAVPDPEEVTAPANYKDPEKIAAYVAAKRAELDAEARERTALEPLLGGTVLAVGIAVGGGDVKALLAPTGDEAGERQLLTQLEKGLVRYPNEPLVAWNGASFDFVFLAKRALRHGLHTLARRCYSPKPWGSPMHVDPFRAWQAGDNRALGKLRQVAAFLGCGSDDDLTGAEVSAAYAAGEVERITRHVISDVRMLRDVYWHLRAAGWLIGDDEVPELEVRPCRRSPIEEARQLMISAAKNRIRDAAEAAGIPWSDGPEAGCDGPVLDAAVTTQQLRVFVRELQASAA